MSDFIDEFSKQLINSGLASWGTMHGCWDYEIRDLENHFEIKLPIVYKDFLKKMGKRAGRFMQGTDMFYSHLFNNREAFAEVLELDEHPFALERDVFVFFSHQGYIFHFFNTAEGLPDPPVYGYREGDLKFERVDERFSDFLQTLLEQEKAI